MARKKYIDNQEIAIKYYLNIIYWEHCSNNPQTIQNSTVWKLP